MMKKSVFIFLLFASGITLSRLSVAAPSMNDEKLIHLLITQQRGNFYADLLSGQEPAQVVFQQLSVRSFPRARFYLCSLVKSGLNGHDFVFWLDDAGERVVVLTESTKGLGSLLQSQPDLDFRKMDTSRFAADLLALWRPNYKHVELLDPAVLKKLRDVRAEIALGEQSSPRVNENGTELGMTWILREGRDLVVTDMTASTAGKMAVSELLRVKKLWAAASPHE